MDSIAQTKRCPKCQQWLDKSWFAKSRTRKDGLNCWCRPCKSKDSTAFTERLENKALGLKRCSKCRKWLSSRWFSGRKRSKDGLNNSCRACDSGKPGLFWERVEKIALGLKKCPQCGEWKTRINFYKNRAASDGLLCRCKVCSNHDPQKYIEKIENRERGLRWCNRCNEWKELKCFGASHYCKQCQANISKLAVERNPQKRREASHKYRTSNKGRNTALVNIHIRRARLRGGGKYTVSEWVQLCIEYDQKCAACGSKEKLTVDHIVPLSKNGTNTINNIQPLCIECNMRKGTRVINYRRDGK